MLIPSGSLKFCAAAWQRRQTKLPPLRKQEASQVRWMNFAIRRPFLHGCGVRSDRESEQTRFIPNFDWFNKWSGGENAVPRGARPPTGDFCPDGIGDTEPEYGFPGRRQFRKLDNVLPDTLDGRIDLDGGDNTKQWWRFGTDCFC